ncbi:Pr6Pr family membrane protein [Leifsonia sp. YAF41]|uniref:Pr6Pr family membrane protein n=1 Tax=Leifsonia sp. YAF41 TaxID=3233086 RepID=UPI003F9483FF
MRLSVRQGFGIGRLVLACAGVVGLIGNFDYVLGFKSFGANNFFSYFTIQSAMAAVVMFTLAAIVAFRRREDPPWLDVLRTLVTTYIIVSGIVFAVMVVESSSRAYRIDVPWSDQLLHFWIPAFALLDWLFDPHKNRMRWRLLGWVVIYPLVWGVFTLIRGAQVGWYPYFFLDGSQVSVAETVIYCLMCLAIIVGVTALLVATSRLRLSPWWTPAPQRHPVPALLADERLQAAERRG